MNQQLALALSHYGLAIAVVNVFVDQLGLPVPAVPTLIIAGGLAANGQLSMAALFAACVLACLLADCGWYCIGRIYGIRVLKLLCRISLEPDSCVSETQLRFERWGVSALIVAKFIPGLGIIAPPMAGALRVGWLRFIGLSTVSAILWVGAGLIAGALFRSQIENVLLHVNQIGSVAAATAILLLIAYIAYKWWERARFYRELRMARITPDELHQLMQAGAAPQIVDVRSATARGLEPARIPGAVPVALHDVAAHMKDLDREREIVLYCTCPSEASAARVARILQDHGFQRVRPLAGGLEAWQAAGYAVESDAALPAANSAVQEPHHG